MIDVKEAVGLATAKAQEMLGTTGSLEEIEREVYKGRDAWSITLGFQSTPYSHWAAGGFGLNYKRFLIDSETGELLAMKLRELASQ